MLMKQLKMKYKLQKGGFLGMLAAILASTSLTNIPSGTGVKRAGVGTIRAGEE